MPAFTAVNAVGTYATESTFDEGNDTTPASGTAKTFGRNVTVDTFEGTNNGTQLFEFSHRLPTQIVEQNFEGSFSVSFVLSTFQWLELFDDDATDEGADGDIDYDFATPQSFEMVVNRTESDITRVATGCVPQSFEIDTQVDGTATVTISGIYANEYKRTSDDLTQPKVTDDKDAINFADVSLTYGPGTVALPRGATLSVDNTMSLLSVLGQRTAGEFTTGSLTASLDITHAVEINETTTLEEMYGSATGVADTVDDDNTITLTFDNGLGQGSGQVKAVFDMTGFTESYSETGIDVQEDIIEADLTETLRALTAEVTED